MSDPGAGATGRGADGTYRPGHEDDRGISTVLDVSVCLLLASAAVLALTTASAPARDPASGRAEEVASTLPTATATVEYDTAGHTRDDAAGRTRETRGTLAGLLADAAVADATGGGLPGYRRAVAAAVEPVLGGPDWRGQVVATWRPYAGSDLRGRVTVGSDPPPGATVHAATTAVPSRLPAAREDGRRRARSDGYAGVAAAVASATVRGLFSPEPTYRALRGPAANRTLDRYRTVGSRYGVRVAEPLERGGPRLANRRLRAAMNRSIGPDLRSRFEDPSSAAGSVQVGVVRITVRAWSA